jgi:hypothetical protein
LPDGLVLDRKRKVFRLLPLRLRPEATSVRRLEVITEAGRERQFSEGLKAGMLKRRWFLARLSRRLLAGTR